MKIFIVEDNEVYAKALQKHLKNEYGDDLDTRIYRLPEDCIPPLNEVPEIVFLDFYFDQVNSQSSGFEILKQIKDISPTSNVVMISGQTDIETAVDCVKFGAFDFIEKNDKAFPKAVEAINRVINNQLDIFPNLKRYS